MARPQCDTPPCFNGTQSKLVLEESSIKFIERKKLETLKRALENNAK
jgi:hypothetical protein